MRRPQQALFLILSIFVSAQFAFTFVLEPTNDTLQNFAAGNEICVFRQRLLMPWVFRFSNDHFGRFLNKAAAMSTHNSAATPEMITLLAVTFLCVLTLIFTTRAFIAHMLGSHSQMVWASFLSVHILNYHHLLTHEIPYTLPYDMPSAAIFGLGTYAAFTRERWLFYPLLVVGALNRETSLFLALLFFVFSVPEERLRLPSIRVWGELLLQLAIWKMVIAYCQRATRCVVNDTALGKYGLLSRNLHMYASPLHWTTYASTFGFLWIPLILFWRDIPSVRLRRALVLLPLWFSIMLYYGDPLEIRLYSEWSCFVAVCVALICYSKWFNRKEKEHDVPIGDSLVDGAYS